MVLECVGICVLSPAHESEIRGSLVYLLIVKHLPILFKFSHSIIDWTALSWNGGRGSKTFLDGSVDHIILGLYSESTLIYIL